MGNFIAVWWVTFIASWGVAYMLLCMGNSYAIFLFSVGVCVCGGGGGG